MREYSLDLIVREHDVLSDVRGHRTPDHRDRRDSCKLTGMQTDTETHGCVGKLLGRQRDKLDWTEEAKRQKEIEVSKAARVLYWGVLRVSVNMPLCVEAELARETMLQNGLHFTGRQPCCSSRDPNVSLYLLTGRLLLSPAAACMCATLAQCNQKHR
ncbi:hypothetical protein Q8A73_023420 [Channa argus]|nr:hypothetical protein Q8A73_023420 [Channa argus]